MNFLPENRLRAIGNSKLYDNLTDQYGTVYYSNKDMGIHVNWEKDEHWEFDGRYWNLVPGRW
jgi:hypothetical protein